MGKNIVPEEANDREDQRISFRCSPILPFVAGAGRQQGYATHPRIDRDCAAGCRNSFAREPARKRIGSARPTRYRDIADDTHTAIAPFQYDLPVMIVFELRAVSDAD